MEISMQQIRPFDFITQQETTTQYAPLKSQQQNVLVNPDTLLTVSNLGTSY